MKFKIVWSITVLLSIFRTNANAEIIRLAYENKEQPPYYLGQTTIPEKPGITVEMIMHMEEHMPDLSITLQRHPWNRCQLLLEKGEVDGIFKASFKPERMKIGKYPMKDNAVDTDRRIATISNSLYKLKNSSLSWDGSQFLNLNGVVGVPAGYAVAHDLRKKGVQIEESDTTINNLKKLLAGRVAAVALQDVTADAFLRRWPDQFKNIVKITPPLSTKPQYLIFSHQFVDEYSDLAEKIWNSIQKIRENDMAQIAERYAE